MSTSSASHATSIGHGLLAQISEGQPRRVLLAEDDHEMRRMLADRMRRAGLEVIEARDGKMLLEFASAQLFHHTHHAAIDLVVSDVRMPGCSGLEVLADLRRTDWTIPVVLVTGFGDRELHAEARRLGAVAVFDKPFELDDLMTIVLGVVAP